MFHGLKLIVEQSFSMGRFDKSASKILMCYPIMVEISKNIFEVFSMPPPKYYTATYEITFCSIISGLGFLFHTIYGSYCSICFHATTDCES